MGRKTAQHKELITPATLQKIRMRSDTKAALDNTETRSAKAAAQEECSEAHREVKRSIRADKRGHSDNLVRQGEELWHRET